MKTIRKVLSALLTVTLISMTFNSSQAAMIANDVVISQSQHHSARAELMQAVQREDVRQQLLNMGVDPAAVESRINLMTHEEIAQLNQQVEDLPAGGSVLGVLLIIFIVFVITDVIGGTVIFAFIKT
ncbi:MAG: PA2779 family protein, partial [Gammaproteobacteria bacterium]|nr:PA2779 family protein [Gammaproteobacteria bacterium]